MKQIQKLVAGLILLTLCAAALASPGIVGKWKGHIDMDWSKLAGKVPPDKIAAAKKQVSALKLVIEFKSNKTFVASGGPTGTQNGTWSETGNTVALADAKVKNGHKQQFTLAKNGKSMVSVIPGGIGKLTLTRI